MTPAARFAGIALVAVLLGGAGAQVSPPNQAPDSDSLGPQTRAMQQDDDLNPGMLWVLDGEELWDRPAGAAGRSCADCHGNARTSMRGVATRYPAFDADQQRPISLEGRVQACRRDRQLAPPLPPESDDRLALVAFVAHQSRGLPIDLGEDERLRPFIARGRELFERRLGQLDLSCADCHDRHSGPAAGRQPDPAGPSDRISNLPSGVARPGVSATAPAQLHDRRACRALSLRFARAGRARALSHVAGAGTAHRDARRAALTSARYHALLRFGMSNPDPDRNYLSRVPCRLSPTA